MVFDVVRRQSIALSINTGIYASGTVMLRCLDALMFWCDNQSLLLITAAFPQKAIPVLIISVTPESESSVI